MSSSDSKQYLICPITLELFNDPVIAEDGNTYEREAITEWISEHGASPIIKKSLSINRLTPNRAIKNAVEAFKQQQAQPGVHITGTNTNTDKRQTLEVLCRYCGLTQQLNRVKEHQLQCSSNRGNIVPFDIADNEIIFAASPRTSSRYGKTYSFVNPFARQSNNSTATGMSNQTSISHNAEDSTHDELPLKRRFLLLRNRKLKYFLAVLLAFLLVTMAITLTVYYVKLQGQESLAAPATSNSTSSLTSALTMTPISTMTSTLTMAPTSTMTSTSTMLLTSTLVSTSALTSTSTLASTSTIASTSTMISTTTSSLTPTLTSSIQTLCSSAEWSSSGIIVASNLYDPNDIAIDSQDNIIVADTENHRLQKYFNNGTNITLLGDIKARSVFIDKFDNIYVTDSLRDEVMILNSMGELITTIDGSNTSSNFVHQLVLDGHPGIYVDSNSTVYISDTGNHRVVKYFANSSYGIVVAGGKGQGPELNQLNTPYGIYVDEINEIGAIYICDAQNHRIQKWLRGANEGITVAYNDHHLDSPISILVQSTADEVMMFISNFYSHQVFKWIPYAQDAQATVAGTNGHLGDHADQLDAPNGIKFDKYWNLFVADTGNDRIQKFMFNISSCENND